MVSLQGTLLNAGTTFTLSPAIGTWRWWAGRSGGGTVASSGGSMLSLTASGGTLAGGVTVAAGATLDGTENFNGGQEYAYVTGGLTLNGTALLGAADGSTYGRLYFEGTQTLTGTGTATFGGNSGNTLYAQGNNGNNPTTLTVGGGIAVQGGSGAVADTFTNDSVVINGTLATSTSGGLITLGNGGSTNSLSGFNAITASNGATVKILESLQINGSAIVTVSPNSSLTVSGNLLGTTQNPALFKPQGTVTLNGSGTSAAPQLLEAMSADLGSGPAGFTNNFAYGTLIVGSNDYVKLVDQSDNSPGSRRRGRVRQLARRPGRQHAQSQRAEPVRSRLPRSRGTITGGSITQIPNSGPLTIDSPTPGNISVAGELDDWTFFGRGGDSRHSHPRPRQRDGRRPDFAQLQWAQVQLLDPSGTRPGSRPAAPRPAPS